MTHNTDDSGFDRPGLGELISLREAAELGGLSAGHLRLLVSRGNMWGMKLGRNWVTTAQAVEDYLARDLSAFVGDGRPRNLDRGGRS